MGERAPQPVVVKTVQASREACFVPFSCEQFKFVLEVIVVVVVLEIKRKRYVVKRRTAQEGLGQTALALLGNITCTCCI